MPGRLHSLSDQNYEKKLNDLVVAKLIFPVSLAVEVTNRAAKVAGGQALSSRNTRPFLLIVVPVKLILHEDEADMELDA